MKKLRLGEFERNSLVVFAITMIANVLSYLYQIVMGNVLTPADYGTVNTLLSLSVVVGVPSGIISALTATYTAKYHAHGETFAIAAFMHGMLRVAAVLAVIVFVAGALLSPPHRPCFADRRSALCDGGDGAGCFQLPGTCFQQYIAGCQTLHPVQYEFGA